MGWVQAVDVIQEAHRSLVQSAGIAHSSSIQMNSLLPKQEVGRPRHWYSVYVDNYDEGNIILETDATCKVIQ